MGINEVFYNYNYNCALKAWMISDKDTEYLLSDTHFFLVGVVGGGDMAYNTSIQKNHARAYF